MYVCMYMYMYIYIYVYVCVCMCVYIHIYIYVCIYFLRGRPPIWGISGVRYFTNCYSPCKMLKVYIEMDGATIANFSYGPIVRFRSQSHHILGICWSGMLLKIMIFGILAVSWSIFQSHFGNLIGPLVKIGNIFFASRPTNLQHPWLQG